MELNAHGAVHDRIIRSPNGRLIRSNRYGWYLFNVRGDVVQRVNDARVVQRVYRYSAFGIEHLPSANNTNNFRFAGMYWDNETQTYYTPNRHFNPRTGRWNRPDPFFHARFGNLQSCIIQAGNLYMFVMHNPVRWIDPWGLSGTDALAPGVAVVGGVSAYAILEILLFILAIISPNPQLNVSVETVTTEATDFPTPQLEVVPFSTILRLTRSVSRTEEYLRKNKRYGRFFVARQYFPISGNTEIYTFYPTIRMSFDKAKVYVSGGGNVFASSRADAYRLARAVGGGNTPMFHFPHENLKFPEIGRIGYFPHYHASQLITGSTGTRRLKPKEGTGHIFFIWG